MKSTVKTKLHYTYVVLALIAGMHQAAAQGTAFTYQGRLNNGTNPANGTFNMMFTLYNTSTGGSVIAGPITENAVAVDNGLFTAPVDFGPGFFTGAPGWLQIAVTTNGSSTFTNLVPRQQLTPTPYAVYAESANASNLVGLVQSANLPGVALLNGGNAFVGGNQTVIGGSIGIGTTSPGKMLEAAGSAAGVPSGGSVDPSVFLRVLNTATDGSESSSDVSGIGFGNDSTREAIVGASYGYDFLDFYVAGVLTSPAMRILGNGNVGIGTTTPANKLDVQGAADFTGNVGIGNTAPETTLQLGNYGLATNNYLTISTEGGNLYRAGIKLRHFNSGYGWTLESDEIDSSFRLYSHFNDTNGIVRLYMDRFSGNLGIGQTNPATLLDVNGEITCTAINITSDRNTKEDFKALNPRDVLDKVAALPITEWQYKAEKDKDAEAARHIGPMAQDFSAAFALGHDEKHISVVDEGGVALAAIQGLNEKLDEKDARIREQEAKVQDQSTEIRELREAVDELKTMVEQMSRKMPPTKAE